MKIINFASFGRYTLFLCIFSAILVSFGLKANQSVVFNKVVYSNTFDNNGATGVQSLSGSSFKFTSKNSTFALSVVSNNVEGTLSYYNSSNVLVSIEGTIKYKTTSGSTALAFIFINTAATTAYPLVVPGYETNAYFDASANPRWNNSGGVSGDLGTLYTNQSSASTSTTSKSVVVSLDSPVGTTESNTSYIVFTLTFSTSRSSSSQTVSFSPSITDVSTTSGSDYTNSIEYSLTSSTSDFTALVGSLSVAYNTNTIYLRLPLIDDLLPESNETFNLSTGSFSGAGIGELANYLGAVGTRHYH